MFLNTCRLLPGLCQASVFGVAAVAWSRRPWLLPAAGDGAGCPPRASCPRGLRAVMSPTEQFCHPSKTQQPGQGLPVLHRGRSRGPCTGASAPPCPCPHAGDIPGPAPGVGHKQLQRFLPPGGHKGCRRGGEDGAQVLLGAGQIKEEKAKEEGAAARGNIGRLLPAINISETFGPAAIALHGAAPCTAAPPWLRSLLSRICLLYFSSVGCTAPYRAPADFGGVAPKCRGGAAPGAAGGPPLAPTIQ